MAYARSGPTSEVLELQQEITHEVNTDAEHLARAVFGDPKNMPDIARVDDQTLEARFRAAYQSQDRKWLIGEAQRDPEQFVKVARRIGAMLPQEAPPTATVAPPMPMPAPMPMAAPPLPPAAPVLPVAPVAVPPTLPTPGVAPPRPVILGPNGQPITMGQ
jgi:hypothetical protein